MCLIYIAKVSFIYGSDDTKPNFDNYNVHVSYLFQLHVSDTHTILIDHVR